MEDQNFDLIGQIHTDLALEAREMVMNRGHFKNPFPGFLKVCHLEDNRNIFNKVDHPGNNKYERHLKQYRHRCDRTAECQ